MTKMLSSWKEIAHFFGKGVRTVQRWEKTLDLPIRRPPGAPSNVVLARTSDLEEWMHRSAAARDANVQRGRDADGVQGALSELEAEVRRLTGAELSPEDVSTKLSIEERLRDLVTEMRSLTDDGDQHKLRRVA